MTPANPVVERPSVPGTKGPSKVRGGLVALAAFALVSASCSGSDSGEATDTTAPVTDVSDDADTDDTEPAESAPVETDAPAADGFAFTSPDGDYTILFPGEPTSTPLPVALPTGQVTAEAFIYEDGTDAAYFTSVFEYAEGTTDDDAEVVLLGARDGAVTNVNGTLVDSEFVELDGVPGVSFSFTVTGGEGNALVFFDEPRLYQSFALGEVGQESAFVEFLDTFEFTDAAASTTAAGDS